jgi:hypothetical protein
MNTCILISKIMVMKVFRNYFRERYNTSKPKGPRHDWHRHAEGPWPPEAQV